VSLPDVRRLVTERGDVVVVSLYRPGPDGPPAPAVLVIDDVDGATAVARLTAANLAQLRDILGQAVDGPRRLALAPPPGPVFRVGQRVRVSDRAMAGDLRGRVGVIVAERPWSTTHPYVLEFDPAGRSLFAGTRRWPVGHGEIEPL
jgi:hypothetical protein